MPARFHVQSKMRVDKRRSTAPEYFETPGGHARGSPMAGPSCTSTSAVPYVSSGSEIESSQSRNQSGSGSSGMEYADENAIENTLPRYRSSQEGNPSRLRQPLAEANPSLANSGSGSTEGQAKRQQHPSLVAIFAEASSHGMQWLSSEVIRHVDKTFYQSMVYNRAYVYIARSIETGCRIKVGCVTSDKVTHNPLHQRNEAYRKCGMEIVWFLPVRKARYVEEMALKLLKSQFLRNKTSGKGHIKDYGRKVSCKCKRRHNDLFVSSEKSICWLKDLLKISRVAENKKVEYEITKKLYKENARGKNYVGVSSSWTDSDAGTQGPRSSARRSLRTQGRKKDTRARDQTETQPSSQETQPSSQETEPSSEETETSDEEIQPSSQETEPSSEETQPSSQETETSHEEPPASHNSRTQRKKKDTRARDQAPREESPLLQVARDQAPREESPLLQVQRRDSDTRARDHTPEQRSSPKKRKHVETSTGATSHKRTKANKVEGSKRALDVKGSRGESSKIHGTRSRTRDPAPGRVDE